MKINSLRINWTLVILIVILLSALFLRVYKVTEAPPALSWDEVAVGYNGYTIASYGRDEYGKFLPLTFRSFGDDKSPVHVYMTALMVKIFGLSDFSIRLGPAVFGTLSVLAIYLLLVEIFKNRMIGLIGAGILMISPFNLQFSRFNHEATFALFFYLFGLWLWFKATKDGFWLPFCVLSFGLCMLSYHSAKIVVPLTLIFLGLAYFKNILKFRIGLVFSFILLCCIGAIYLLNQDLLGLARAKQTTILLSEIQQMPIYSQIESGQTWFPPERAEMVSRIWLIGERYIVFYQSDFLYLKGDNNLRFSTQNNGQFYRIEILFLLIGAGVLVYKRDKVSVLILLLGLIAPLPAAVTGGTSEIGHSGRALFIMASWTMIAAIGAYQLINYSKFRALKVIICLIVLLTYLSSFIHYWNYYYSEYLKKSAIEWQYGMKEIVEYTKAHPEFSTVYMTDVRSQPYIFYLNYLKYPLYDYLREVEFDPTDQRPHNNVYSFGKYHFGDWDQIHSMPMPGVLYIVEPSMYSGLAHKQDFNVKRLVKYPDGSDAYFMVSMKE